MTIATHSSKSINLRWRILIPVIVGLILLITAFAIVLFGVDHVHFEDTMARNLNMIAANQSGSMTLRGEKLAAVADVLAHDPQLIQALSAGDRQALLTLGLPKFERLKQRFNITHFYFHDAQRRTLLRLHNPTVFGDRNERTTAREAELSGQPVVGVELGKTATYTLRAVVPVKEEDRLIGYIEVGEETLNSLVDLAHDFSVDGYVLLYKTYLDRNDWEQFMRVLGRTPDWERYPDMVLAAQTQPEIPTFLGGLLLAWKGTIPPSGMTMALDKQLYNVGSVALLDAEGQEVGQLVVMRDVTALIIRTNKGLFQVIAYTSMGGIVLSIFLYFHLKDTEEEMARARAQIVDTAKAREADQRRHIEDMTGRINDLERFERLTVGRELRIQEVKAENHRLKTLVSAAGNAGLPAETGLEHTLNEGEGHDG